VLLLATVYISMRDYRKILTEYSLTVNHFSVQSLHCYALCVKLMNPEIISIVIRFTPNLTSRQVYARIQLRELQTLGCTFPLASLLLNNFLWLRTLHHGSRFFSNTGPSPSLPSTVIGRNCISSLQWLSPR
jgi:hypothetical protein